MGGRGSSSATANEQRFYENSRNYLEQVVETFATQKQPRAKILTETAQAALSLLGTEKSEQLNKDHTFMQINFFARKWGYPYTGFGELSMFENATDGNNQPLGSKKEDWERFIKNVQTMHSKGYTNAELAAALRFDELLHNYG